MYKLVSSIPKANFEKYDIQIPNNINVVFLKSPYSQEELSDAIKDADFLFVSSTHKVSKESLINTDKLKMIHTQGVGFDQIDLDYAKEKGIIVINNKAVNAITVAELTISLMLEGLRKISLLHSYIMNNDYNYSLQKTNSFNNHELYGKTIGLIGLGDIGVQVAKRLKAFETNTIYYKRNRLNDDIEKELNVNYMQLEELIKTSDIISLHLPLNRETKYLINKDKLKLMKKSAILINTSRGDLINQDDLIEALNNDEIEIACLDVYDKEPLPSDSPLLKVKDDKLILTPHIGGNTIESRKRALERFIKDLNDYIENKKISNIVNC